MTFYHQQPQLQRQPEPTHQPHFNLVPDTRPVDEYRLEELLNRSKLNWTVETEPLVLQSCGTMTDFLGVVRSDTRETFQTVTKQYHTIQNRDFAELALKVADAIGSELKLIKSFDNGAVQYLTIEGRKFSINGAKVGDVVGEQMMLCNSHNGQKALGISFGHVVLSCTNGMTRFDRKGYISIRHTESSERRLKEAIKGVKKLTAVSSDMIESYKRLTDAPATESQIKKVLTLVTGIDMDADPEKLSTRAKNIATAAHNSIMQEMTYKGRTLWGLLNGATHYTSTQATDSETKLKSKLFGAIAKRDFSVYDFLTKSI